MKFLVYFLVLVLAACSGSTGPQGPQGPQGPNGNNGAPGASAYPGVPDSIVSVVQNYNEYLYSVGSDPIEPGLKCTLYTVPNMPSTPCLLAADIAGCNQLSSSSGFAYVQSFTYTGTINQPNQAGSQGFNLLPTALRNVYQSNFELVCTGYFVNVDYSNHEFDVSSDDGSLLYIGGLVVQNDGEHSIANVKSQVYLQPQVYSFQLDYFQGPGNVALIVNMDGSILPTSNLWH